MIARGATATDVTTAAGDLGGEGAVRGQIQAVGNRVIKTDGGVNKPVPRSASRSRRAGECGAA